VVIDAGHGGDDPGAVGPGVREKDVCLDVARRLHKILSADPDLHPILTRSRDVFVPLRSRMRLAEEADADLFVSIHVNAAPTARAHGVEVFFLSIRGASDEAAQELARFENEAPSAAPTATDVEEEIPFSLSLRQSDTLLRSSRAAEVVLDRFVEQTLAENRGVRQASFAVLRSYLVPSILVELGFVSSPTDRAALASAEHRGRLASALAEGVSRYFEQFAPLRRSQVR
jgi:N-acetylmuramoyl-L-alanine amidase